MRGKLKPTGFDRQYFLLLKKCISYFDFSYLYPFLDMFFPYHTMFSLFSYSYLPKPSQGIKKEKYSHKLKHQRWKYQLWRELNTLPSFSTLIGCVFSISGRKIDGRNPSKMDIKLAILATKSHFIGTAHFLNWKKKKRLEN